jgi:hypothetical protein
MMGVTEAFTVTFREPTASAVSSAPVEPDATTAAGTASLVVGTGDGAANGFNDEAAANNSTAAATIDGVEEFR